MLATGVGFALLTATLLVNSHYQPTNEVEAYKKFLRDHGERLAISEVIPPPVPAESNSVEAVRAAFGLFTPGDTRSPYAMRPVAPGRAMVGWQQPEIRGYDFTNSWAEFADYIAANRAGIQQFQAVFEKPVLDFNLEYKKGATLLLPHLAPLKRSTQTLTAAAICDLHHGDAGAAATNILTVLALVQKNSSEGLLISHLVRLAMTAIAVAPTWELLQATKVTDAQLAAVQNGWAQLEFLGDATNAFTVERAWGINEIQKLRALPHAEFVAATAMRSSWAGGGSVSSSGGWDWEAMTEGARNAVGEFMWRSSWSYADELRLLKGESTILEALRCMRTNQSQNFKADYDAMKSRLASLGITNVGAALFQKLKIPDPGELFGSWDLSSSIRKTIRTETARRLIVTAIALKRFQLQHAKLPATLTELLPEFLSSVPIDPNDGLPLRYHANSDGTFLLYSVGEDGQDDGGDPTVTTTSSATPSWQNDHARDWVWPQPASALEIQTNYEEEAKKAK